MATLFALGVVFTVSTQAASAGGSSSFNPTRDSYVDAAAPTQNFGTSAFMRVDNVPVQTAYLRFDVQDAPSHASAMLRVYAETGGADLQVYKVANNSWTENGITANNAPAVGQLLDAVSGIEAGKIYSFDVSDHVSSDGAVSFAVKTSGSTSIRLTSREGTTKPELLVPAPPTSSPFTITRSGSTYTATGSGGSPVFTGSARTVVEAAVADLRVYGGGTISFMSGTFDLGADSFHLVGVEDIVFEGQGMGVTTLTNNSSQPIDTEIFSMTSVTDVTIRNMTLAARGSFRSTSDALDFDDGNDNTIDRVEITSSRSRGIVFDGKGAGWTADGNSITNCVITGLPSDGIELLAANNNTVTGCTITNVGTNPSVGGHGIQVTKASSIADQPNKQSNGNVIAFNVIDRAGSDGININSGSDNIIVANVVTNGSSVVANRDGIRIQSSDAIACDRNEVSGNTAGGNGSPNPQRYGLNISSGLCKQNIVGTGNDFDGNRVADINDLGTNTQYGEESTTCPSTMDIGNIRSGVAARDNATGPGWLLWSSQDVHGRFGAHPGNADHLIAVVWDGSTWLADNNSTLTPFTPAADDCLVAQLDFSTDSATIPASSNTITAGIHSTWATTSLMITPDRWNGVPNDGEFGISGTTIGGTPKLTYNAFERSGGFGDFDGDGKTDLFVHGQGSQTSAVWFDAFGSIQVVDLGLKGNYRTIIGKQYGIDNRDDVLLYRPGTASDALLTGEPDRTFTTIARTINGTYSPIAGDFDGNGLTDIFWYSPGSALDYIWYSDPSVSSGFKQVQTQVTGTYTPIPGDFDGDTRGDILWYRPGSGADYTWYGKANRTFTSVPRQITGTYFPIPGDFDDDGRGDIFWYRPGSAPDYIWYGKADRTFTSVPTQVIGGYFPSSHDLDGDGSSDILWLNSNTPVLHVWYGKTNRTFTKTTLNLS